MRHLALHLLGAFEATLDGKPTTGFKTEKARALLIYLAMERGRAHRRQTLVGLLWPDYPESSARANLRQVLTNLRQVLGDEQNETPFFLVEGETLQLNPESNCWLDVADFERLAAGVAIENLESAIALYRGGFLEGFTLKDSPEFDNWTSVLREHYLGMASSLLGRLGEKYEQDKDYEKAVTYARKRLELEPWQEDAHRQLMRQMALSGQRTAALMQYEACRKSLKDELGVEPSVETRRLYESIRDGEISESVQVKHRLHNLPVQLTSFIGREKEIAQVKALLQKNRLVTLTGSGGVGKTRLSLQVGGELLEQYPDGVWLVELASVTDPQMTVQAAATALGLRSMGSQPIGEVLRDYLHNRKALLVLDNCEHLIAACAALAQDLLQACQRLKILASSREALGVGGEISFHVPSLELPDLSQLADRADFEQIEAVHLFVERARAARADFQVRSDNAEAVVQVCQRLDGIPLAIELAAASLGVLTVSQLASRLDDAFRLLTGGARTALPRQQTLRATIDWSYKLLSDGEKRLLRRLAVFVGSFDLAAVEAVCCLDNAERMDAVKLLSSLAHKSMLRIEHLPGLEMQYHILETVRQYACEKLQDVGESPDLRDRHAAYFLGIALEFDAGILGPQAAELLRCINVEFPNIRAAMEWDLNGPSAERGACAVLAMQHYWTTGGALSEGSYWLERAMTRVDSANPTPVLAELLLQLGWNERFLGYMEKAQAHVQLSREMYQELGNRLGYARATGYLAFLTMNNEIARAFLEESTVILRELGEDQDLAFILWNWGIYELNLRDRLEVARSLLEESEHLYHTMGCYFQAAVQCDLGELYWRQRQLSRARSLYQQGSAVLREVGDQFGLMMSLYDLGTMEMAEAVDPIGLRKAEVLLLESLEISRRFGRNYQPYVLTRLGRAARRLQEYPIALERLRAALSNFEESDLVLLRDVVDWISPCLLELAEVEVNLGKEVPSATILGALQALGEPAEKIREDITSTDIERVRAAIQSRMDEASFRAAWEEGRAMTLEQAVAYAKGKSSD